MPARSSLLNLDQRSLKGRQNFLAGQSAEGAVERLYLDRGFALNARRWGGGGGELDLVFQRDDRLVFVEVKKSHSHDLAAARVSQQQISRILTAAGVYLDQGGFSSLTDVQFDVALVDGGGEVQVLENALMAM